MDNDELLRIQNEAIQPFVGMEVIDVETRRTPYGERLSLSVDTDVEFGKAIVNPVILFVPDEDLFDHHHIEIRDPQAMYDWLGEFLRRKNVNR
jgi:hypothetical protein